jgi:LPS sulfotransferase NodH
MRAKPEACVTIVTGVPRSGTSLVMQMLAAGGHPVASDGVRRADPDNPRGYFELEAARGLARDASWVPALAGRAFKLVHTLLPSLPPELHYRVLFVQRRLDEVLASQRVMLARRGPAPDSAEDARLLPALEEQLARTERWLDAEAGLAWLRIEHAELIAAPGPAAARIRDFLGGGLDAAAMAACVDPSLHRQRR